MKRGGPLKRGAPMKRTAMKRKAPKPKPERKTDADLAARDAFWREAQWQRVCAVCGTARGHWNAHHVIYEQHLVAAGAPVFDPDNAMRLCDDCHRRHHNRSAVIALTKLRDRTIAYAFAKLGLRAYSYLQDRYAGEDQRLEQALAKAEQEQADGRSDPAAL